jgi:hypothetical protein
MSQDPYSIKPGEKLTPQELFNRFINWYVLYDGVGKPKPTCDPDLYNAGLCCSDHFQLFLENTTFMAYFRCLHMIDKNTDGFSIELLSKIIVKFNIKIDREKYSKFWGTEGKIALRWLDMESFANS